MSRNYFEIKVKFDDNCGSFVEERWYARECNTTDYFELVDRKGDYVEARGTDSYIKALSFALRLEDYDGYDCFIKINSISVKDIPIDPLKTLDYPTYKRLYCSDGSTEIKGMVTKEQLDDLKKSGFHVNEIKEDDSEPMSQNDILKIING